LGAAAVRESKIRRQNVTGIIPKQNIYLEVYGMNWGTVKKGEMQKKSDKVVELRPGETGFENSEAESTQTAQTTQRTEDLESGMELLELDFLLGVIENAEGADKNDVMMRKMCFSEVIRRNQQNEIDSYALKVYALNDSNIYGKDIQCESMKEMALRTTHKFRS
jgi:hypothetical protein